MHALQQATKHLPIRRVHVQSQRDHIINHHMRRQIPLAHTALAGRGENLVDFAHRKCLGDHAQTDVIGDPAAFWKCRNGPCHLHRPLPREAAECAVMLKKSLSERYWALAWLIWVMRSRLAPLTSTARWF